MADAEEQTLARDFVMARLGAGRAALAAALASIDEAMILFCEPAEDPKGEQRVMLMESADEGCAAAASSIQLAEKAWEDVNPKEGEPDDDEEEEEEEEDPPKKGR